MQEKTKQAITTAVSGLMYSGELIDMALLGEKRGYNWAKGLDGPFAQALTRIAEIADGAQVEDMIQARKDMLFLFDVLVFLQGGFYQIAWDIISRVHKIVADRISEKEAAAILGEPDFMMHIYAEIGKLHPVDENVYAGYEVEVLKQKTAKMNAPIAGIPKEE